MWHDDENKLLKLFESVNEYRAHFPARCSVCGQESAHIYMHRHDEKAHGGLWVWCSECHAYSHTSAKIPEWWKNPSSISIAKLQHSPDYLNQHVDTIDCWVNNMIAIRDDSDFINRHSSINCEKCGTLMEIKQFGPSFSVICHKCGWGIASTHIDPLHSDPTEYKIVLLQGNDTSVEKIKAVNQVTHRNLVKSRKVIETAPVIIFKGKATDILNKIKILDSQDLKYEVQPDFPFFGEINTWVIEDGFEED